MGVRTSQKVKMVKDEVYRFAIEGRTTIIG
jgi:hypothetical protein